MASSGGARNDDAGLIGSNDELHAVAAAELGEQVAQSARNAG